MSELPDAIADAPLSAKLCWRVLSEEGPLTQQQLVARTQTHRDTVRVALRELADRDCVIEQPCHEDARQSLYRLPDDA
jgi:DNA-binding MarR family transcriptional regulator